MPLPIREEDLHSITRMVYALYAKHGFDGISMDEISRKTGISKATLYRYFTSKEDIVRSMVDYLITSLDSVNFTPIQNFEDVINGMQEFYVKSVLIAAITGSEFLDNLEKKFPDIHASCRSAMAAMQERFAEFFQQAVDKGYLRTLSFPLVCRQCRNMLPVIINMDYLEQNRLSLSAAIREYYRIFLCQILTDSYISIADQCETYDFVSELTEILRNDFFIDSIRR